MEQETIYLCAECMKEAEWENDANLYMWIDAFPCDECGVPPAGTLWTVGE